MIQRIDSRRVFPIIPLMAGLAFAAGCAGEGEPQTAEPPKMEKPALSSPNQAKPAKGMDRLGSESPVQ